jgi:HAD superfamily hydrolase (TIGR01490 family)
MTDRDRASAGAAFFDLDKTLMQGSSAFQFARAVRKAGLMTRRQLASDALANLRFRLRGASDRESEALRDRIAASLEGIRVRDLERLGVPVLLGILPRLYPRMLEIAYEHQDAGRPVYIITAAAQELAETLARVMAFDGALGSHLSDVEDGAYTGHASGPFLYRDAKATAIAQLAEEHGFDLAECYAYSDSASDLPMLEIVGHAVVVNPDAELERLAHQRGWEVLRLDRLGHRLMLVAAGLLSAALAAGGIAGVAAAQARSQARTQERLPQRGGPRPPMSRHPELTTIWTRAPWRRFAPDRGIVAITEPRRTETERRWRILPARQ